MLFLIVIYLLLVLILPLLLSLVVSYRALPVGRACPHCRAPSVPLVAPVLRVLSTVTRRCFQRRWCLECGWEGVARVPRMRPARRPAVPAPAPPPEVALTRTRSSTRTLDLRWRNVNGESWRVLLQCWSETGRCYGRLVFVAPSGKLWADALHPLTGRSADEVLGQALSLPEGTLASRLREVASE